MSQAGLVRERVEEMVRRLEEKRLEEVVVIPLPTQVLQYAGGDFSDGAGE